MSVWLYMCSLAREHRGGGCTCSGHTPWDDVTEMKLVGHLVCPCGGQILCSCCVCYEVVYMPQRVQIGYVTMVVAVL